MDGIVFGPKTPVYDAAEVNKVIAELTARAEKAEAELAALRAENERLSALLDDAPHEANCTQNVWADATAWIGPMPKCDCWRAALGGRG